jgi:CRP/FNR family transcriptional regulator
MRLVGKSERTEICSEIGLSARCFLCDLSGSSLGDFNTISLTGVFPRGAKLFTEGQRSKGVFILCNGSAKLSISSSKGRSLVRIAEQGEILGLSATILGSPYEDSAEMLESGQVNFIQRDHFLSFLRNHAEASLRVAEQLSHIYTSAREQMRALVLSDSAAEKLARLLLGWGQKTSMLTGQAIHLNLLLTHEEIAQMIGVSRETVTRLLGEFRATGIIQLKGHKLVIKDIEALEEMVTS